MQSHRKIFVCTLVGLCLTLFVVACNNSGGNTVNNVTTVNLESNDNGCSPKNIETEQGNLLKLSLKNSGSTEATFSLPEVSFVLTAPAGQTVLGNLTAPTATGKFKFTCGNPANPTQGELQVKSN